MAASVAPSAAWSDLKSAFLHLLMPANSAQDCALKLTTNKQSDDETVSEYALRWRKRHHRCEAAVGCANRGRTAWVAVFVTLWHHGLKPSIQVQSDNPPTSFERPLAVPVFTKGRIMPVAPLVPSRRPALQLLVRSCGRVQHRAPGRMERAPVLRRSQNSGGKGKGRPDIIVDVHVPAMREQRKDTPSTAASPVVRMKRRPVRKIAQLARSVRPATQRMVRAVTGDARLAFRPS